MLKTDVLIIGGGLAGLAAAKTLEGKKSCIVAERENCERIEARAAFCMGPDGKPRALHEPGRA